ncbi:hypothetical protein HQ585_02985 [candidate division KSB1 bacterium]|nr:hypothetical protein [candidate division KSB1 bacterium]
MKENIGGRFTELVSIGQNLIKTAPHYKGKLEYWVPDERVAEYQQWISSSANLINIVTLPDSTFRKECARILADKDAMTGISSKMIQKMYGLLSSAKDEWEQGLLRKIEYMVVAETFDDFLDHADVYHKGNKKTEASVLASAVLEDTVKRIAKKNSVKTKGVSLDPLIDEMVKVGTFTPVKAKRVKAFAGVRNHAMHAEWEEFDIKDVGELIAGTRELIDTFL